MARNFVLASRASQLAQVQTNAVQKLLEKVCGGTDNGPTFSTSFMQTGGDKNKVDALFLLGGKALWTKELEVALVNKEVDFVVHSLKDVPTALPEGCVIGAILEREDPVDSLVVKKGKDWKSLDDLPDGSVVGTGSVRRIAQLKRNYPNLKFLDVRGNLDTRLQKLDAEDGSYSALILAKAGLVRMGWGARITMDVGAPTLYYAVGQGALAVEIREGDLEAMEMCGKIRDQDTWWKCAAERACLADLEGGCSVPVGVTTAIAGDVLSITGCVTSIDGREHVQYDVEATVKSAEDAEQAGKKLAGLLLQNGGAKILEEIKAMR